MAKKKKSVPRSEIVYYRLIISSLIALVSILFLYKESNLQIPTIYIHRYLVISISAIASIASLIYYIIQRIRHVDESSRVLTSIYLCGLSFTATVALFIFCFQRIPYSISSFIVTILIVLALYFIFNLYQREFYFYSIFSFIVGILFYVANKFYLSKGSGSLSFKFIMFALLFYVLLCIAFTIFLKTSKGSITVRANKQQLFDANANLLPILCALLVALIISILACFLPGLMLNMLLMYLLVFFFCGIYYTIKLM